jgi:Helix-turn-helix domain
MPEIKRRVRKPKVDHPEERLRLMGEFGVMTEGDLAILFGVEVKTLKNRKENELPPFTKTGGQRLFFKDDVMAYMRKRMS